jgi:hypothetical protein
MADDLDPEQFARELMRAVEKTPAATVKVVRKGSQKVKTAAKRNVRMTAPIHNAHAATAINYDVEAKGVEVVGEIGYDKSQRPGRIGNLLEFGGGGDHSPPHHDLARAVIGEADDFEDALADMGEALISGAIEATLARMDVGEVAE